MQALPAPSLLSTVMVTWWAPMTTRAALRPILGAMSAICLKWEEAPCRRESRRAPEGSSIVPSGRSTARHAKDKELPPRNPVRGPKCGYSLPNYVFFPVDR